MVKHQLFGLAHLLCISYGVDILTTDIVIVALNLIYLYKESTPNLSIILNVVVYVVFVHSIYHYY